MSRKHIHVTCAIVEKKGLVLAAQRSAKMSLPLKWEFPGGKIREGESPDDCLTREMMEELNLSVTIDRALSPHIHRYPNFTVTLYPFVCVILAGNLLLHEHAAVTWLAPEELHLLDWAEADLPVLATYLEKRIDS